MTARLSKVCVRGPRHWMIHSTGQGRKDERLLDLQDLFLTIPQAVQLDIMFTSRRHLLAMLTKQHALRALRFLLLNKSVYSFGTTCMDLMLTLSMFTLR